MTESNNPATGLDEAAQRFAQALGSEPDNQEEQEQEQPQSEGAEEAPDQESEPEEQNDQEQPDEAKFEEVEIDGKRHRIPAELKSAFLMQQDYTRKTQEVAEHRRQVDAYAQQVQQQAQQYGFMLNTVQQFLQNSLPPAATEQLWEEDPVEAAKIDRRHRAHLEKMQAVYGEQQRISNYAQQQQEAHLARFQHEQSQKMLELVPEWRDPAKARTEQEAITQFLLDHGHTRDQLQYLTAAQAVIARDAWLYRQAMSKQKTAKPAVPQTVQPGPSRHMNSRDVEFQKAKHTQRKTGGRLDASAAVFAQLMKD